MHSVQQIGALGKSGAASVSVEWCTGASGRLAIKGGFEVLKMKDKRRRPDKPGGERNQAQTPTLKKKPHTTFPKLPRLSNLIVKHLWPYATGKQQP